MVKASSAAGSTCFNMTRPHDAPALFAFRTPLQGPVYLRSSNHELPDLVASLDGQIHVDLAGRIDSVGERIRNTFWAVPDAPVSKFVLTMKGGAKGLLVNNTELCDARPRAKPEFAAQNGKVLNANPAVKTDCGKSKTSKRRR